MIFFRRFILFFILLILLIYISNISNLPDTILLLKGEPLNLKTVFRDYYKLRRNYTSIYEYKPR